MKNITVYIFTIALLGLFLGGSITVLFIIIPFWQTLQPEALMEWFHNFNVRIAITMLLMEVVPLLFSIYAYFIARKTKEHGENLWILVNVSNIIILLLLFVYFIPANLSFINKTINPDSVAEELIKWKTWHIARTILALLSTLMAIFATLNSREGVGKIS